VYEKYRDKERKPRLHPVAQAVGDEWRNASKVGQQGNWDKITLSYVENLCENGKRAEPDWHDDVNSLDLSQYIAGLPEKKMWWLPQTSAGQSDQDGAWYFSQIDGYSHLHIYS
jgi:hypothetical protein